MCRKRDTQVPLGAMLSTMLGSGGFKLQVLKKKVSNIMQLEHGPLHVRFYHLQWCDHPWSVQPWALDGMMVKFPYPSILWQILAPFLLSTAQFTSKWHSKHANSRTVARYILLAFSSLLIGEIVICHNFDSQLNLELESVTDTYTVTSKWPLDQPLPLTRRPSVHLKKEIKI